MHPKAKLGDLNIGDRFYYPGKKDNRWRVTGKVRFNAKAGTATRLCYWENKKDTFDKLCSKEVYILPPINK